MSLSNSQIKVEPTMFILIINIILMVLSPVQSSDTGVVTEDPQTFLYFAYGSNLLKERLQLMNPSATLQCVAKLQNYKLVFGNHNGEMSERWRGGVASIEPSAKGTVWGLVWRMNTADLASLDRQEGVNSGVYSPVLIHLLSGDRTLTCRTYMMNHRVEAPPSPHYLKVIMMGAEQNKLPKSYQNKLKSIKTNQYDGSLPVIDEINAALKKAKNQSA